MKDGRQSAAARPARREVLVSPAWWALCRKLARLIFGADERTGG